MSHEQQLSKEIKVQSQQVAAVIGLLDEGNTLPFIARYRKEATGNLDEEQIRYISEQLVRLRALDERRKSVQSAIKGQEKLTPALNKKLVAAQTMTELEDLYQPYRKKRTTRSSVAREQGLEYLAELILSQPVKTKPLGTLAKPYLNATIADVEAAFSGARDIVAETISDHADVRRLTRAKALEWGEIFSVKIKKAEDGRGVYKNYYEFNCHINRLRPHQILAINRGDKEKILRVKINIVERDWRSIINRIFHPNRNSPLFEQLDLAIQDAAKRLLLPAIERDVRRELTDQAEAHAISVFAVNMRALLSQPPLAGHVVLGIDPGYRSGSKVTVLDATSRIMDTATIYPHKPQGQQKQSITVLMDFIKKYEVTLIAIGNGTASRETEQLIADLIQSQAKHIKYIIVSEAGASVYSASHLARAEMPDLDVSIRGAVSIARRVQDPLAELVKIEPKAIGVGMYQHDVNQKQLTASLTGVVESVVNKVGVDVSTASPALLNHVSGIGKKLANAIVAYRDQHGVFQTREALKKVPGLGAKAYEQSAGFFRIRNGSNPLDASAIHPESYSIAEALLDEAGLSATASLDEREDAIESLLKDFSVEELANRLKTGVPTLEDIIDQLIRPGRDPREDAPLPILRSDVLSMDDLSVGLRLKGTVRNVVDFGAFIDIGVKQDGLLHRSKMKSGGSLQVGDVIDVEIENIDPQRGRISLAL